MDFVGELQSFLETDGAKPIVGTPSAGVEGLDMLRIRPTSNAPHSSMCDCISPDRARAVVPYTATFHEDHFEAHVYMTDDANDMIDPIVFMLLTGNEKSTIHLHITGAWLFYDVCATMMSMLDITKVNTVAHIAVLPNTAAMAMAFSCKQVDVESLAVANLTPIEVGAWNTNKLVMQEGKDMNRYNAILLEILIGKGITTQAEYDEVVRLKKTKQLTGADIIARVQAKSASVAPQA